MSHVTGTVQPQSPVLNLGPDFGPQTAPNTWEHLFSHTQALGGTKLLLLHFQNVSLPANNRLEVGLGYGTDVFTSADGSNFWTRPINIYVLPGGLVPIRYITNGAGNGGVQLDKYGRGERHAGTQDPTALSNCDPFLKDNQYTEPKYDPFWFCQKNMPNWENSPCETNPADVRTRVARSVGMIVSVEDSVVSTCSVTLVDSDLILTAGHCHTPDEALTSSVIFGYEVNCDGSKPTPYNPQCYKVKQVVKFRDEHTMASGFDYSLLRLASAPIGIPAIQMRHDIPKPPEQVFGIHHPNGAVKKLSIPHPNFNKVLSSDEKSIKCNFDVSGGSSGSGLFDTAGRIVGVLSVGSACSLSYFPTASILKDIIPAPPPPVTRDVMIVFDRSGSMSEVEPMGRTKIEAARDALSLFVQLVRSNAGNRIGLVSFSTTSSAPVDFGIAPVNPGNKLALIGTPPYSGGKVGGLSPAGATSIGEGLESARLQFPGPGVNPRAILLLTDGMQNTPRWISDIEPSLNGIGVHAIGFGTDTNLDGSLLTSLATAHNGIFTRAESGLALEKFFSHAFGNIFEAGILIDPEYDLSANQRTGPRLPFHVCGEEIITLVIGWDRVDASLLIEAETPGGNKIFLGSTGTEGDSGQTWAFLRISLPFGGERNGLWHVSVFRPGGGEFPPPAVPLRYFVNIIPSGGPKLLPGFTPYRYFTGDTINPLVLLRYPDGGWPTDAKVEVTVSVPDAGAGNILSQEKLHAPIDMGGDIVPARFATLQAVQSKSGTPLISYIQKTFTLSESPADTEGSFEPSAVFGKQIIDLLNMEGNYRLHYKATYGGICSATRELFRSIHVDVGIDATQTTIDTQVGTSLPGGAQAVDIIITPRDKYGNNLGPGRTDAVVVSGNPGTTVGGTVIDNGDGSYTVPGTWAPDSGFPPGVVVNQPGRPPVVVQPTTPILCGNCEKWKWLFFIILLLLLLCLFLVF